MRVLAVIALLASVGQSRWVPDPRDRGSQESLASLLLAVAPAVTPRSVTPRVPASRRTSPAMIVDPNELASSSMLLADLDPRLLIVGAAPATAASWALFNVGRNAITQIKNQGLFEDFFKDTRPLKDRVATSIERKKATPTKVTRAPTKVTRGVRQVTKATPKKVTRAPTKVTRGVRQATKATPKQGLFDFLTNEKKAENANKATAKKVTRVPPKKVTRVPPKKVTRSPPKKVARAPTKVTRGARQAEKATPNKGFFR